jgi:hypothetical protein
MHTPSESHFDVFDAVAADRLLPATHVKSDVAVQESAYTESIDEGK